MSSVLMIWLCNLQLYKFPSFFVNLFIYLSIRLFFIHSPINSCSSIYSSPYSPVYLFTYLLIHSFIEISTFLSIYVCIYFSFIHSLFKFIYIPANLYYSTDELLLSLLFPDILKKYMESNLNILSSHVKP